MYVEVFIYNKYEDRDKNLKDRDKRTKENGTFIGRARSPEEFFEIVKKRDDPVNYFDAQGKAINSYNEVLFYLGYQFSDIEMLPYVESFDFEAVITSEVVGRSLSWSRLVIGALTVTVLIIIRGVNTVELNGILLLMLSIVGFIAVKTLVSAWRTVYLERVIGIPEPIKTSSASNSCLSNLLGFVFGVLYYFAF